MAVMAMARRPLARNGRHSGGDWVLFAVKVYMRGAALV